MSGVKQNHALPCPGVDEQAGRGQGGEGPHPEERKVQRQLQHRLPLPPVRRGGQGQVLGAHERAGPHAAGRQFNSIENHLGDF